MPVLTAIDVLGVQRFIFSSNRLRDVVAGSYLVHRSTTREGALEDLVPREKILLETDSPYLPPHPHRGERNEPAFIPLIAAKLGELWGMDAESAGRITTANAKRLFNIP